jgi:DNA-binding NtrC family response regulator
VFRYGAPMVDESTVCAPWSRGTAVALCIHGMAHGTLRVAVTNFKRQFIEAALREVRGNRTHAARALGLKRTYLLHLMRELAVDAPPSPYHEDLRRRNSSPTNAG